MRTFSLVPGSEKGSTSTSRQRHGLWFIMIVTTVSEKPKKVEFPEGKRGGRLTLDRLRMMVNRSTVPDEEGIKCHGETLGTTTP